MGDRRPKIQYLQLPLAFMTEGRGEPPNAGHGGTESLTAKRGPEDPATIESLMEEVCERENLERAWHQVRSNQGSPGVDGRTIDETRDYLREHWPTIREQLLDGTYRPQPVRRVEIAKPDGGVRKLGIPMCRSYCTSSQESWGIPEGSEFGPSRYASIRSQITGTNGAGSADQAQR